MRAAEVRSRSARAWARLIRLELARVTRTGGVTVAAALLLLLGVYAGLQGNRRIQAAEDAAAAAETAYRDQLAHLISRYPPATEAGELLYYLTLPASQPPSRLSALAGGRTEIETANLRIRLLALEGQLYEQETLNPRLAAAGRLDLAFVLVALLPLFVIAVTYDIVSGERERGTWDMARLFARPRRLLAAKVGARVILVGGLVTALALAGASLVGAPLIATSPAEIDGDGRAGWAAALIALHTLFWFALCLGVAVGRRSSTANAMILVGMWVAVTFLAPAVLSLANAVLHPVPEALELTVRQRQGYHEAWDLPPSETMEDFYKDYPEWSDQTVPEDEFTWAWYYAMNHRGDQAARDASRRLPRCPDTAGRMGPPLVAAGAAAGNPTRARPARRHRSGQPTRLPGRGPAIPRASQGPFPAGSVRGRPDRRSGLGARCPPSSRLRPAARHRKPGSRLRPL